MMRAKGLPLRWPQRLRKRLVATRADESGVTTLEWLLIVAAVAGLAALAVVLVQNVVSETSEQIAGSSARLTAAQVAASSVEAEAKQPATITDDRWKSWNKWDNYFTAKCERIEITFSDAVDDVTANFDAPTGEDGEDPITATFLGAAVDTVATATEPQVSCAVT